MTLPGIPVLYYGDELGLAGASDPDSRRVMPDLALLTTRQRRVLDVARKLGKLRADLAALRTGEQRTLIAERDRYVFTRGAASNGLAVVLASKSPNATTIVLASGMLAAGDYVDAMDGAEFRAENGAPMSIAMEPFSLRILTRRGP
jgi:glycosidase